ncbi:potassium voltage-gated channel subfamily H member 2 [Tribolium castaneum]|uniref:Potassium/sodium hyperpolarization-activated cyclic nucleotide-gated channel 3-like Protein n=1 Tax=Tribolium castaneum TaxID=7070 RepID=D2A478_TRICA|nr:PREDICTED: potassium voltage-gated channel subfamily H member 2 [Tribolium castaneum]EFA04831.1 Potassium/sodium hyperpolarization-activated cyclic nucleotide-gated channel 3-like Protein [Tribolium castaneum]|eukprot:XP_970255.1 PREDICTED: potassium voltage-gated channel subfamily H member 2 [Tribolium castaneum]
MAEKHFRLTHKCNLQQDKWKYIVDISPHATWYEKCWFKFREFCTVYKSAESSTRFRSNRSLLKEKLRHLKGKQYRFVIHPFSRFVKCEELIMLVVWFIIFLFDPFLGSFFVKKYVGEENSTSLVFYIFWWVVNILVAVDTFVRFFTGYMFYKTEEIVLEMGKIFKNYIRTYFFIDAIPLITSLILQVNMKKIPVRTQVLVIQIKMLRLFRLPSLIYNLRLLLKILNVKDTVCTFVYIGLIAVLLLHWWTCLVALIPITRQLYNLPATSWVQGYREELEFLKIFDSKIKNQSYVSDYLTHMQMVLCHFYGAGKGAYAVNDPFERIIFSLILISGLVFSILTLANVLQTFGTVNISEAKFEEFHYQTQEYMTKSRFSHKLRRRVNKYLDYKYAKRFFHEDKILNTLSEHLRMEVLLYSCKNLVEHVQIFRGLSRSAVGCILALLKQEIYLPKDTVMSTDKDGGKLFFVLYGTCLVNMLGGQEFGHIEDGHQVGEISFFESLPNVRVIYKVVAAETSEVYCLEEKDLHYCCLRYPEIILKLQTIMDQDQTRLFQQISLVEPTYSDVDVADILTELREGRIISRGRKRNE